MALRKGAEHQFDEQKGKLTVPFKGATSLVISRDENGVLGTQASVLQFTESCVGRFGRRGGVVFALAARIVAGVWKVGGFRLEKHTSVNAFGMTALARYDAIALHGWVYPS
jgi:hypothetical protein